MKPVTPTLVRQRRHRRLNSVMVPFNLSPIFHISPQFRWFQSTSSTGLSIIPVSTAAISSNTAKKLHPSIDQILYGVDLGEEFPLLSYRFLQFFRPATADQFLFRIYGRCWFCTIKELAAICVWSSICHWKGSANIGNSFENSSSKLSPYMDSPPIPVPVGSPPWIIKSLIIRWKMTPS